MLKSKENIDVKGEYSSIIQDDNVAHHLVGLLASPVTRGRVAADDISTALC